MQRVARVCQRWLSYLFAQLFSEIVNELIPRRVMCGICSSWRHLVNRYTTVTINCWRSSPACDVCETFGSTFPVRPREWFWIDSNGKMGTRHPAEGYLVVSFGRSVIIVELRRPEVTRPGNFASKLGCVFKTPYGIRYVKFSKFRYESFCRLTDRRNCV